MLPVLALYCQHPLYSRRRIPNSATADPVTLAGQIDKLKQRFRLHRVVMVGDRGVLSVPGGSRVSSHAEYCANRAVR